MESESINGFVLVIGSLGMLLLIFSFILFIFLYQRKILKKKKAFEGIEKLLQKQELQSAYNLIKAQDNERKRVASDVHDNLGSMLATLKIYTDLTVREKDDTELRKLAKHCNGLVLKLITEVRQIAHSLDGSTLKNFGLETAIKQLCEAISNSGKLRVMAIIDIHDAPTEGQMILDIYRVTQELFTNTLKHAQATDVRFEITQVKDEISMIYEDNGVGFQVEEAKKKSMGLQNIASRVDRLHGTLSIESSEKGSTFIVEIPYYHDN
jgi:two-component system NarL family sensor kinase